MKTPIYPKQLERACGLFKTSADSLALLTEERLNLDTETRDAINEARTAVAHAELLLLEQPVRSDES